MRTSLPFYVRIGLIAMLMLACGGSATAQQNDKKIDSRAIDSLRDRITKDPHAVDDFWEAMKLSGTPLAEPIAPALLTDLEAITSATFGQRRKMLRQSLKGLVDDAEGLVRSAQLDPTARPEQLSVSELAALARAFARWREGTLQRIDGR